MAPHLTTHHLITLVALLTHRHHHTLSAKAQVTTGVTDVMGADTVAMAATADTADLAASAPGAVGVVAAAVEDLEEDPEARMLRHHLSAVLLTSVR